eukprot:COSAG01_NODE_394_length_17660_cov_5.141954_10_plen_174_part_00
MEAQVILDGGGVEPLCGVVGGGSSDVRAELPRGDHTVRAVRPQHPQDPVQLRLEVVRALARGGVRAAMVSAVGMGTAAAAATAAVAGDAEGGERVQHAVDPAPRERVGVGAQRARSQLHPQLTRQLEQRNAGCLRGCWWWVRGRFRMWGGGTACERRRHEAAQQHAPHAAAAR